jgi:hypothetical protein
MIQRKQLVPPIDLRRKTKLDFSVKILTEKSAMINYSSAVGMRLFSRQRENNQLLLHIQGTCYSSLHLQKTEIYKEELHTTAKTRKITHGRPAIDSSLTPGPKNSTNLPTTPTYVNTLLFNISN